MSDGWRSETYGGWGNVLRGQARLARPESLSQLTRLLREHGAALPVGNRRSYGDAAVAAQGRGIITTRLDRFIAFDPETGLLTAEAGLRLGEILACLAPQGWMPAILPGTGMTTIGGAIANDVHGKNHHHAGSFGQSVKAFTLIAADGQKRDVTRADDALFRATLGGLGQTGLIVEATLQLARCPSGEMRVEERRMPDLDAFLAGFAASEAAFEVGWIDATATGTALGRGILETARFAETPAQSGTAPRPKRLPPLPGFLLAPPIVRLFNALYFRRVPASGRQRNRSLAAFFFPLDRIENWNILYGAKGFHQFQCVLPSETAPATLRTMLEIIAAQRNVSPLAVLKRMGADRAGYLSFPREGFTLAVDIPNRNGSAALLTRLHELTIEAGGRIYMAKDSVATPEMIAAMYPELGSWRKVVNGIDPDRRFESALTRRLGLRGDT